MDNRERIIETAADLFKSHGIKSVTMDSIATELGMSKRTIYEIFADKDELLIGVLNSMAVRQKELVRKVLDESDNAIVAIFRLLEINRDHFQNTNPAFMSDIKKFHIDVLIKKADKCEMPDYRSNIEVIVSGIKQKLFRKDINPDIVNRCLHVIFMSVMNQELFPYDQFTRKEVMKAGVLNYLRGISTEAGTELINKLEKKF
ncbi:MAG TPA: TetR/AcrR family transcriptional regulator [Bacteroidales bacterium]|nr:TetR/AcrR family transcriptional regulator [Bacteroidales bacterium]